MAATDIPEEVPAPETSASAFPWDAPAAPALNTDATQRLIGALPEDTFELIVREAYLFRAGQIILQAMSEAKARRDLVDSSRPPFLVFRRPETKDAFNASLAGAAEDLSLYERAVKRNAEAMKGLRKSAELHIEGWLRENDATYYAGLVSEALVADWHRCLARLESELNDFIAAVGCARNSLVASQADAKGVRFASKLSRKGMVRAAELGALLANDVTAANALADERSRHLQGTAFERDFSAAADVRFRRLFGRGRGLAGVVSPTAVRFDRGALPRAPRDGVARLAAAGAAGRTATHGRKRKLSGRRLAGSPRFFPSPLCRGP